MAAESTGPKPPRSTTQKAPESLTGLRSIACQVLARVMNSKDTLDEAMTRVLSSVSGKTFPDFDRSWIFEVVSGVLRYRGRVDFIIDTYALKKKPAGEIRRFLELAIYQLLAQEVPPALVVSETVQAIRLRDGEHPAKFANAILRKVADQRENWRSWRVTEESPFLEQVAWCSLPEWLFKKLRKDHGSAWVFAFSEAVLDRPTVWYRTRNETLRLEDGYRGDEPPGFVQDISNQKLVDEAAAFLKSRRQEPPKILDLCSAPGGKSLALAFAGFSVTATDVDAERLDRVRQNVARLGLEAQITVVDHEKLMLAPGKFDLIWIDAPCSSTGIVRRHPEIKWNRTFHDVEKMILAQQTLIDWAKHRLEPGGWMLYSTCSLLEAENPASIEGFELLKKWEWFPQNEPRGDGIRAALFGRQS